MITGGIFDFLFFEGNTADDVIKLYHTMIGKPALPPFWALGYFQSAWAYDNQQDYETVVKGYSDAGVPLEGVFFDIEYMDAYKNFEVDMK